MWKEKFPKTIVARRQTRSSLIKNSLFWIFLKLIFSYSCVQSIAFLVINGLPSFPSLAFFTSPAFHVTKTSLKGSTPIWLSFNLNYTLQNMPKQGICQLALHQNHFFFPVILLFFSFFFLVILDVFIPSLGCFLKNNDIVSLVCFIKSVATSQQKYCEN